MTTSDRNVSRGHFIALSRVGTTDGARADRHPAADVGVTGWHDSWWNNTWMALAKCRDMDPSLFFPSDPGVERAAQRICAVCPVRIPCLEYSLDNHIDHGVWGGKSERERRFLQTCIAQ